MLSRLRRCPSQHQMPTLRIEKTDTRPKGIKRIGLSFRLLPTLAQVSLVLPPELPLSPHPHPLRSLSAASTQFWPSQRPV